MITKMKKYTFLVFHREYEQFLSAIRSLGVVHITQRASGEADDQTLQSLLQRADEIRKLLQQGATDQLLQDRSQIQQRLLVTQKEAERMAVFGSYSSTRMAQLKDAGYEINCYTCPSKRFESWMGVVIQDQKGTTWFARIYKANEDVAPLPEYCSQQILNARSANELQQDIEAIHALLVAADARIEAWQQAHIEELKHELYEVQQAIDWQKVTLSTDSIAEGSLMLLEGFCPVDKTQALNDLLAKESVYYEAEDPKEEDATPIQLKNNWFVRMFECLTGMYGWPNYSEFDPTPILGPFFLLFFSLCIGDAGYGLALVLVGYLIHKEKLKIEMFSGMGPIIMALGVGSTLIGYMMGGFFGIDLYAANWFPEAGKALMFKGMFGATIAGYDVMMVLALVIGIVHICLAMTIKAICFTRRFGFLATLSAWGWLILILGGLITAVLAMMHWLSPESTKIVLIAIGGVSAFGIFLFNNPKRNPLINIGAGLWDTYGMVTGILGDVLSYIRLYALGLAGGMLGAAFNNLGSMVLGDAPSAGSWIGFVLIIAFGHILNLLMACLGAFVHPLRLSFVEYFKNAGYEGQGKQYQPFKK